MSSSRNKITNNVDSSINNVDSSINNNYHLILNKGTAFVQTHSANYFFLICIRFDRRGQLRSCAMLGDFLIAYFVVIV